jgi:hypothetical protein
MDAAAILEALRRRYRAPAWAFFPELRTGTGYDYGRFRGDVRAEKSVEKRLDAWAFHLWPSGGYQPTGFEIKATRSDFLRELARPDKTARYMRLCQFFYYATPTGLVQPHEVPEKAGLIWVNERRCRVMKRAPNRGMPEPEWDFFAAVCRRVDAVSRLGGQ